MLRLELYGIAIFSIWSSTNIPLFLQQLNSNNDIHWKTEIYCLKTTVSNNSTVSNDKDVATALIFSLE